MSDEAVKVLEAARYLFTSALVRGTWGNVSLRKYDKIWITPSGISYDDMKPEDIAVVNLDGHHISGKKPSSELPLHMTIYKNKPEIKAMVHFHGVYSSVFAVTRKDVKCYTEDQAQILGGDINVAEYAFPGTQELAFNALKALEDKYAVLLANHGAVTVGRNLKEAIMAAEILEKSCQIAILVSDSGFPLPDEDVQKLREHYLKSYSKNILKEE